MIKYFECSMEDARIFPDFWQYIFWNFTPSSEIDFHVPPFQKAMELINTWQTSCSFTALELTSNFCQLISSHFKTNVGYFLRDSSSTWISKFVSLLVWLMILILKETHSASQMSLKGGWKLEFENACAVSSLSGSFELLPFSLRGDFLDLWQCKGKLSLKK